MLEKFFPFIFPLLIIITNYFFKKKNILCSFTGDSHQKFTNEHSVPLTGGLFIYIFFFLFLFNELLNFQIFIFLIFLIGISSDLNLIRSPEKRFLLQIVVVVFSVIFNNLTIQNTGVDLLDYILKNNYVNYFFVSFCILIIVNGLNFLDGLNTLAIGYFSIILLVIVKLNYFGYLNLDVNKIYFIILFFIFIFFCNLFNKMFMGDSGSYLLGFIISLFLIIIYSKNSSISSFFIVLLLWYPSFENLFSLIRKSSKNRSPLSPDKNHLHQLFFYFISKKIKKNKTFVNSLSSVILNFYNFIIFLIASNYIYSSQIQIILIILNILVYLIVYLKLFNFKYGKYLKKII